VPFLLYVPPPDWSRPTLFPKPFPFFVFFGILASNGNKEDVSFIFAKKCSFCFRTESPSPFKKPGPFLILFLPLQPVPVAYFRLSVQGEKKTKIGLFLVRKPLAFPFQIERE